ncbi:MAG: alpha/beta hydrolase [Bdellovibrionota bacterium]
MTPNMTPELTTAMKEVLDTYATFGPLPIDHLTPQCARQLPELKDAVTAVMNKHISTRFVKSGVVSVGSVEHTLVPTVDGELVARIYKPRGDGPFPVTLYFHGGGWVIGSINSYDSSCRALCSAAGSIVVSIGYRQAPENPYPAAHDDAYASYKWLLSHADRIGGDSRRIAIAGESAGGNLAASVCIRARDEGLPLPVHQLLIYPVVDWQMESGSYQLYAQAKPLSRDMMKWFMKHYFENSKIPLRGDALPLLVEDLRDLPPATVITAEVDPLCNEGEEYAHRLFSAGVPVTKKRYEKVTHEFFGMGAVVSEANDAVKFAAHHLQLSFDTTDVPELEKMQTNTLRSDINPVF